MCIIMCQQESVAMQMVCILRSSSTGSFEDDHLTMLPSSEHHKRYNVLTVLPSIECHKTQSIYKVFRFCSDENNNVTNSLSMCFGLIQKAMSEEEAVNC